MPGLFEPYAEQEVIDAVARLRQEARSELEEEYDLAVDYLENRQIQDIESELLDRFPATQAGDTGQRIYPVTLPLTRKFIDEQATAYSKAVKYKLVGPDGEESDDTRKQTDSLNRAMDEVLYTETQARLEQMVVLLGSCGNWYQHRQGNFDAQIVLPQNIHPVVPDTSSGGHAINPGRQGDYAAFVNELFWKRESIEAQRRTFAFVSNATTSFYEGTPTKVDKILGEHDNPFVWDQMPPTEPTDVSIPQTQELPLSGMTIWHRDAPLGSLIPLSDIAIVRGNREINVAWSLFLDTARMQGYGIPVKKVTNPSDPAARQRHGSRHVVVLSIEESFEIINSATDYTGMVGLMVAFQKTLALTENLSPNDFALEGQSPASGFAKVMDSLPKILARKKHVKRMKFHEEQIAWPRIGSILVPVGRLDASARQMRMIAEYEDFEVPRTPDEESKQLETDIKYNLSTPAHHYARRHNVTIEDATEAIKANAELNKDLGSTSTPPPEPAPQQRPGLGLGGRFGGSIGQRGGS